LDNFPGFFLQICVRDFVLAAGDAFWQEIAVGVYLAVYRIQLVHSG
jgi:hypothetical protein